MTEKTFSLQECAKKLGCSKEEIESALLKLGLYKRITVSARVNEANMLKLSEHFNKYAATKKPATDKRPSSQRKIGETQITESKTRARNRPPRADLRGYINAPEVKKPAEVEEIVAKPVAETIPKDKPAEKPAEIKKPAAETKAAAVAPVVVPAADPAPAPAVVAAPVVVAPAPAPAAVVAPAPVVAAPAAVVVAAPVAPAPAPTHTTAPTAGYDSEKLLRLQQEKQKQEKLAKEKSETKVAAKAAAPPPQKAEEKTAAATSEKAAAKDKQKAKPKGTIKIDQRILDKRKKFKKSITRREARQQTAEQQHSFQKPTAPVIHTVKIPEAIAVSQLASSMSLKSGEVIRKLMAHDMEATANHILDKETAWIIVEELGHNPVDAPIEDIEEELLKQTHDGVVVEARAPVITVMGHVDHGKTSLLDYLRKTRVAVGEAGGITQHIGAYRVQSSIGPLTFIDTPGHALFTQMRAHGAEITDIVTLVVAADDGVKPQTIEAINHAKAAKVPIVVAVNKIDKPEADLERVKRELADNGVLPDDWGGDAIIVPVSATTGEGVDALLEALATQADLLELNAPVNVPATGVVIETRIDKGRGIVATLIINGGRLRCGDAFLCGSESGRVRAMWDITTPSLEVATASMPVEIQGLDGIPESGAQLMVLEDERRARDIASARQIKIRSKLMSHGFSTSDAAKLLDEASAIEERRELKVIIKADVEGSREALTGALTSITGDRAGIKIVHSAVGGITESDVHLAQASNGIIVGFNVRPNSKARKIAKERNVSIIADNIVYNLVENTRNAVLNLLDPTIEETVIGTAEVLKVFSISKVGSIAGSIVSEGVIRSRSQARLVRDGVVVYEGRLSSLRHFKDESSEVRAGSECGIGINKFNDIKVGDIIEIIEQSETPPEM